MVEPRRAEVAAVLDSILALGRRQLGSESLRLLLAYGIPAAIPRFAPDPDIAVEHAQTLGFPVVLKIHSPDISRKAELGGVRLSLYNAEAVRAAFAEIMATVAERVPAARLAGVELQPMYGAQKECFLRAMWPTPDRLQLEFAAERARLSITPTAPLADTLAWQSVAAVEGFHRDAARALADALDRAGQLVSDFPLIADLEIDPLLVLPDGGCIAVDCRMTLSEPPHLP